MYRIFFSLSALCSSPFLVFYTHCWIPFWLSVCVVVFLTADLEFAYIIKRVSPPPQPPPPPIGINLKLLVRLHFHLISILFFSFLRSTFFFLKRVAFLHAHFTLLHAVCRVPYWKCKFFNSIFSAVCPSSLSSTFVLFCSLIFKANACSFLPTLAHKLTDWLMVLLFSWLVGASRCCCCINNAFTHTLAMWWYYGSPLSVAFVYQRKFLPFHALN